MAKLGVVFARMAGCDVAPVFLSSPPKMRPGPCVLCQCVGRCVVVGVWVDRWVYRWVCVLCDFPYFFSFCLFSGGALTRLFTLVGVFVVVICVSACFAGAKADAHSQLQAPTYSVVPSLQAIQRMVAVSSHQNQFISDFCRFWLWARRMQQVVARPCDRRVAFLVFVCRTCFNQHGLDHGLATYAVSAWKAVCGGTRRRLRGVSRAQHFHTPLLRLRIPRA